MLVVYILLKKECITVILYHGTWEDNMEKILEIGYIDNEGHRYSYEDTELIDSILEEHIGYNPRNSCIYLSNDVDTVEAYDYAFKVDTSLLNLNLLFVGSNKIIQDIYCELPRSNPDENKVKKLVQEYADSIIPFSDFLKINGKIDSDLEFMYFDKIYVSESDLVG